MYNGNGGLNFLEWWWDEIFDDFALQLNRVAWEIVKELYDSWSLMLDPFNNMEIKYLKLVGTETCWQLAGNEPLNWNPLELKRTILVALERTSASSL